MKVTFGGWRTSGVADGEESTSRSSEIGEAFENFATRQCK
jgi:hypothetical protein